MLWRISELNLLKRIFFKDAANNLFRFFVVLVVVVVAVAVVVVVVDAQTREIGFFVS